MIWSQPTTAVKEPGSDRLHPEADQATTWVTSPRGHAFWMNEAIQLARSMKGWVWPNPSVGCVIVNDGEIVGRGRTQFGGRPHAERVALDDAGANAKGATLYVTLEPCCHWGKTSPCADAIIEAGISRVYASLQDPDPRVNGGGFRRLADAGIAVEIGLAADQAREIMTGFFHRIATGAPLVTVAERLEPPGTIADGFDAELRSIGGRLWLFTRAHGVGIKAEQIEETASSDLLRTLGTIGLTTIFVSSHDPLASVLRTVG